MKPAANARRASWDLTRALSKIGIGKEARATKLSNERLRQIATTMYLHQAVCSNGMVSLRSEGLSSLVDRLKRHADYYDASCPAHSALEFISEMIRAWYKPSFGSRGNCV